MVFGVINYVFLWNCRLVTLLGPLSVCIFIQSRNLSCQGISVFWCLKQRFSLTQMGSSLAAWHIWLLYIAESCDSSSTEGNLHSLPHNHWVSAGSLLLSFSVSWSEKQGERQSFCVGLSFHRMILPIVIFPYVHTARPFAFGLESSLTHFLFVGG